MIMPGTVLLPDQNRQAQAKYFFFPQHDPSTLNAPAKPCRPSPAPPPPTPVCEGEEAPGQRHAAGLPGASQRRAAQLPAFLPGPEAWEAAAHGCGQLLAAGPAGLLSATARITATASTSSRSAELSRCRNACGHVWGDRAGFLSNSAKLTLGEYL